MEKRQETQKRTGLCPVKEPDFVAACLQVPRQLARRSIQLIANANLGVTSHCKCRRKREDFALGGFVCRVEVMVFHLPRRRKLKPRPATCVITKSSAVRRLEQRDAQALMHQHQLEKDKEIYRATCPSGLVRHCKCQCHLEAPARRPRPRRLAP